MQRTMLKAKLHHARVTHSELEYEGSCAIDGHLLDTVEFEEDGALKPYAIRAEDHSGIISINGAAAHKARPGDRVIICTYATLSQQEVVNHKPNLVYLNEENRIKACRNSIPVQVA